MTRPAPASARPSAYPLRFAALLAALSGALYALAFPPFALRPAAALALVPLFAAAARVSPARAAALGVLWATVATACVTWWMPRMLHAFFDVPLAAGAGWLVALGALAIGPAYALFAAWLAWSARRGAPAPWTIGAAWLCAEWLRAHGPVGSPWALLGYAAVGTPLAQAADLAGPAAPGWAFAVANAAAAGLALPALRAPRARAHAAGALLLLAALAGYGALRLGQRFDAGSPFPVAVIQSGVTWSYAFDPAESELHLRRHLTLTEAARTRAPRLVVWPEHAVDFYLRDESPERAALLAAFAAEEPALVLGAPHYERPDGRARYLNSVFLVTGGEVAARSDKARLVPFAERSPLGALAPALGGKWTAGAPRVLAAPSGRLGAFVCAEAMFPDVARTLAREGAELLINPSNDFWFRAEPAARLQLETASLRAIEERRWLVRATPTGYSALVDPHGSIRARAPWGEPAVLAGEIALSSATTPFQHAGEAPMALAAAVVVLSTLLRLGRSDPSR
jgi:apolipoprotein N-acyltransferase